MYLGPKLGAKLKHTIEGPKEAAFFAARQLTEAEEESELEDYPTDLKD